MEELCENLMSDIISLMRSSDIRHTVGWLVKNFGHLIKTRLFISTFFLFLLYLERSNVCYRARIFFLIAGPVSMSQNLAIFEKKKSLK
jgi:hypothetical protein